MYADPKHLHNRECKVRFNEDQDILIEKAAAAIGKQKAAFVRELALEQLTHLLATSVGESSFERTVSK